MSGSGTPKNILHVVREFLSALRHQARYKRNWPLLILIAVLLVPAPIFGLWLCIQGYLEAMFGLVLSVGSDLKWLQWWCGCSIGFLAVVAYVLSKRHGAIQTVLTETGRKIEPGVDPKENFLFGEVQEAANELGLEAPPVFLFQPRPHDPIDSTCAYAGPLDSGQVAITESTWSLCTEPGEIRMLVRHELAHIKHRDGFVDAILVAITFPCALLLMGAVLLTACFTIPVFFGLFCYALAVASGNAVAVQSTRMGLYAVAANPFWLALIQISLGLLVVTALLEAYRCGVSRASERAADKFAIGSLDAESVRRGLELIRIEEGTYGDQPEPISWGCCLISSRALVGWMLGSRARRDSRAEALKWWGRWIGNAIAVPLFLCLHLPGAPLVRKGLWRLYRTHPTPSEREAFALEIMGGDGGRI